MQMQPQQHHKHEQKNDEEEGETTSLLKMYNSSFRSNFSANSYTCHLKSFAGKNGVSSLFKLSQREAEDKPIDFIITNKESGMAWGALHNYLAAVAKFYLVNDINLNMNRVKRFIPEQSKVKKDRAYRPEEIQKLTGLSNERVTAMILVLCSSGMRLGGLAAARISDLEDRGGDIYKITVYPRRERNLIKSIVANLTIKRIPDADIIKVIFAQTNKTITDRYLSIIRQQIKRESYHWYRTMREGEYEYIHEFKERIDEILSLQKKHHEIIGKNEDNPTVQQVSLAELHGLNITLSNYFDVAPDIFGHTIPATPEAKAARNNNQIIV